jgi:hypothetical protein
MSYLATTNNEDLPVSTLLRKDKAPAWLHLRELSSHACRTL